ncbi:DNA primase small subunit [Trypanosoma cruzi]|nr:DNA primase small subunit [Trypanosoma cruzi]
MGKPHLTAGGKINRREGTEPVVEPPSVSYGPPPTELSLESFPAKSSTGFADINDESKCHRFCRRQQPRRKNPMMMPRKIRNVHPSKDLMLEEAPPLEGSISLQLCSQSLEKNKILGECFESQTNGSGRSMAGDGMPLNGSCRLVSPHSFPKEKHSVLLSEEGNPIDEAPCATNNAFPEVRECSFCGYMCIDEKIKTSEDCFSRNILIKEETERFPPSPTKRNQGNRTTGELMPVPVVIPIREYCDTEAVSTLLHREKKQPEQQNEHEEENQEKNHILSEEIPSGDHLPAPQERIGQLPKSLQLSGSVLAKSQTSLVTTFAPTNMGRGDRDGGDSFSLWGNQQQHGITSTAIKNGNTMYEFNGRSISSLSEPPTCHQHHHRSYSFTPEVSSSLIQLVDEQIVAYLSQTAEKMMWRRQKQLRCVSEYLTEAIAHEAWRKGVQYGELRYYVFGSVATYTVLPDGDNDMTFDVEGLVNPTKIIEREEAPVNSHARAIMSRSGSIRNNNNDNYNNHDTNTNSNNNNNNNMSLSQAAAIAGGELLSSLAEYLRENNPHVYVEALVVAEVRVLKLVMEGSCFDITVGQLGGVVCVRFLQEMDMLIGCQHLLKRTLLLLKAWCCYEAHILSGQGGYLSSYAATIMLISMMNTVEFLEDLGSVEEREEDGEAHLGCEPNESLKNISPLQLFARFLKFFSFFDFEHYCVTVFGPLPCACLDGKPFDLSQLEVLAGKGGNLGAIPKSSMGGEEATDFKDPMGMGILGLTAEGQRELGHCIRRRAKPLITVNWVKHILRDEHIRRQDERKNSIGLHREMGGMDAGFNNMENIPEETEQVRLDFDGGAQEDATLFCSNFDTSHFSLRTMNVMDPLRWSASLCRGVSRNHLQRIRRAFREGLALFEKGSIVLGDTSLSSLAANSQYSDVSFERSSRTCESAGIVSDPVWVATEQRHRFDAINSVLKELFGHTLMVLRKHNSECSSLSVTPRQVRCKRCPLPSFFCASHLSQLCESPYLLALQDSAQKSGDERDEGGSNARGTIGEVHAFAPALAVSSQRNFYPHQQPQRQLNMLTNSLSVAPTPGPMLNTVSSKTQNDSLRFANSVNGVNWQDSNKHFNRDSCMNLMDMPQHPARGAPLLRYRVKGTSLLRFRPPSSAVAATNCNLCSAESASFQCYPDFPTLVTPGTNSMTPIEPNAFGGAPMGFAPLPLPPPPPVFSSISSIDTRFQTNVSSQKKKMFPGSV